MKTIAMSKIHSPSDWNIEDVFSDSTDEKQDAQQLDDSRRYQEWKSDQNRPY